MNIASENLFSCPICGMRYADEAVAKRCEAWCREHKSCNLDIIGQAVDAPTRATP